VPGKRKPKAEPKPKVAHGIYYCDNEAVWGGFINIRLDDEQKAEFYAWLEGNSQHVSGYIEDLLAEEAKVSMVFDRENECFIVTVAGTLVGGSSERYVTSSRAGTLPETLALTAWKHFVLADGDYGNYRTNGTMMKWG